LAFEAVPVAGIAVDDGIKVATVGGATGAPVVQYD
jgi:hypothetical protein